MKLPKHRRDEAALNSRLIRRPIKRMVWLFLLPTFGAFCIGFLYPFFKGLFLSFCNFRITSQWTWTGLENYRKAFQDPGYMHAFWYTALFALVSLIAINLFAFAIAYALTQKFKGTNVFRTVFFLPNLIGGIVLGYIWSMIFDGILIKYNTSVVLETKYGFWGLVILCMPLGLLLMLVFGFWFQCEICCQIVYGDLNRVFHIEESIQKLHDAQLERELRAERGEDTPEE